MRLLIVFCLLLPVAAAPPRACPQTSPEEYQVKAAFIFHFAQLVEWPAGTLGAANQPLTLCMLDDEPQSGDIRGTVDGKLVGEHVLHVRLLGDPTEIQGCNILFLSRHEARRETAVLQRLRSAPILTVGETDSFLAEGGMIRFHFEQNRVRFDINVGAADLAHLRVSSRLLLLATSVIGGATRGGM